MGQPSANLGLVNGGYFAALAIRLLRGRTFGDSDTADRQQVAIVDERLVMQYFPSEEPLGRQVTIADDKPRTIVGIVGAVKQDAFEEKPRPHVYLPYQQLCTMNTRLAIKTRGVDPLRLMPLVRGVVKDLDKDLPIANVRPLPLTSPQVGGRLLIVLLRRPTDDRQAVRRIDAAEGQGVARPEHWGRAQPPLPSGIGRSIRAGDQSPTPQGPSPPAPSPAHL
jgi:hypothetical protein